LVEKYPKYLTCKPTDHSHAIVVQNVENPPGEFIFWKLSGVECNSLVLDSDWAPIITTCVEQEDVIIDCNGIVSGWP